MAVLCFVAASEYLALVFSYLYLWTVAPQTWAGAGAADLPSLAWPVFSAFLVSVSFAAVELARRLIGHDRVYTAATLLLVALLALLAGLVLDTSALLKTGLRPTQSGYAALVYASTGLNAQLVFSLVIMAFYTVARIFAGRLTAARCVTFDCLWLFWAYMVGQFVIGLVLVHGFPRLIG
jgi:cytochrome c oxidase subunit I+III